jgi:hypothetical protein
MEDYPKETIFQMIAYKNKLVVYSINYSKEVLFLNKTFQINAII